jgi:hypothetical protein
VLTRWWHRAQLALFPIGVLLAALTLIAMAKIIKWPADQLALFPLILVLLLHFSYVLVYGFLWNAVTIACKIQIPLVAALPVYLASIAGKYLPLRILSVTHRAAYYVHVWKRPVGGMAQAAAYESVLAMLAGLLIASTGVLTFPGVLENMQNWKLLMFIGLVVAVITLLHPAVQRKFLQPLGRYLGLELKNSLLLKQTLILLAGYLLAWALLGSGLYCLANVLKLPAKLDWIFCVQVYALAGTAGMFVFVLPSGIGIREGVMTSILLMHMDSDAALFLTLSARVMVTAAELLAAAAGGAISALIKFEN